MYLGGRKRERGIETLMWGRNIDWLPLVHILTGDWTPNIGMFPSRNRIGQLLLCRTMPNQLSHIGQGIMFIITSFLYHGHFLTLLPKFRAVAFLVFSLTLHRWHFCLQFTSPNNQPESIMSSISLKHKSMGEADIQTPWLLCLECWVLAQPFLLTQGCLLFFFTCRIPDLRLQTNACIVPADPEGALAFSEVL